MNLTWLDLLGYLGTTLVILSFCMTTMLPLRIVALLSNLVFVVYGYLIQDYPLFVLNFLLIPINGYKFLEIKRFENKIQIGSDSLPSFDRLLPIMLKRTLRAGEILFLKDDKADRLYYIQEGLLEIVDLRIEVGPGNVLGEIGMFTTEHKRTATVMAKKDTVIYELTENQVKESYFMDPALGFSILQLVTQRLIQNERRLTKLLKEKSIII